MAAQIRSLPSRYSIVMTVVLALIAMFAINASFSEANGLPANKVAASASDIDVVGADQEKLVLSEVMKVSTTRDLMLHLSAECSILTRLNTAGSSALQGSELDSAFGQVEMHIEIDGKRVPVVTPGAVGSEPDDSGEVVFCNRAYERSVTNAESPNDGWDGEQDFIRTRAANAFTWLALDAGRYDDPSNGNNVIQVDVFATYETDANETDTTPANPFCPTDDASTCAEAAVGARTLVVDTDVAANDEVVSQGDPTPFRTDRS